MYIAILAKVPASIYYRPFQKCFTNRHRYCAITELLAKSVGIYMKKIPTMESDGVHLVYFILAEVSQSFLNYCVLWLYQSWSSCEKKMLQKLWRTRPYYWTIGYDVEVSMRHFSRDMQHKCSRNHRHACVERNLFVDKDLLLLTHFTFMQLYQSLVNSKEKMFDNKSMEAIKLLIQWCKKFWHCSFYPFWRRPWKSYFHFISRTAQVGKLV